MIVIVITKVESKTCTLKRPYYTMFQPFYRMNAFGSVRVCEKALSIHIHHAHTHMHKERGLQTWISNSPPILCLCWFSLSFHSFSLSLFLSFLLSFFFPPFPLSFISRPFIDNVNDSAWYEYQPMAFWPILHRPSKALWSPPHFI